MLDWKSTLVFDSAIVAGVRYHLKRFSAARRAELALALASHSDEMRQAIQDYQVSLERVPTITVPEGQEAPPDSPEIEAIKARNNARFTAFQYWATTAYERHEKVATLKVYLKKIEGMSIDGTPATVQSFVAEAADELAEEAFRFIQENGGISGEEIKNSQPPTTSREAEGGQMRVSTAVSVETGASSPTADAGSTSST